MIGPSHDETHGTVYTLTDHELLDRHRAVMPDWMPLNYRHPLELVHGSGRRVTDSDGRTYLDFFGGMMATMLGHNVPEIVAAVKSQSDKILHTSTLYLIRAQIELAEKIAAKAPVDDPRVFFVNSGSEAVDTALMLASHFRSSNQILAMRGSYHGRSLAAAAVTGLRSWSPSGLTPFNVAFAPNGYKYRSPYRDRSDRAFIDACRDDLRTVIETSSAGAIACYIAEPIQGAGGITTPPDGYFAAVQSVLDDYGIPFVSDETQTAWGRTGYSYFGIEHHGIRPKAMTFAKGLANGLSIGGVVAEASMMNTLTTHSISTAGGNPVAMAAANAVLDFVESHSLQQRAEEVGTRLGEGLHQLADQFLMIGEVRGSGLMWGLEIVHPHTLDPDPIRAADLIEHAREAGLLIGGGGLHRNILRLTPPMTITSPEITEALSYLRYALTQIRP